MYKEICVRGGILGSIRWHDGDGNENFKNAIGWIEKNNNPTHTAGYL